MPGMQSVPSWWTASATGGIALALEAVGCMQEGRTRRKKVEFGLPLPQELRWAGRSTGTWTLCPRMIILRTTPLLQPKPMHLSSFCSLREDACCSGLLLYLERGHNLWRRCFCLSLSPEEAQRTALDSRLEEKAHPAKPFHTAASDGKIS